MAGVLTLTTAGAAKWKARALAGQHIDVAYSKLGSGHDATPEDLSDIVTEFDSPVKLNIATVTEHETYIRLSFEDVDLASNYTATEIGIFDSDDVLIFYASVDTDSIFIKEVGRLATLWISYRIVNPADNPAATITASSAIANSASEALAGLIRIAAQEIVNQITDDTSAVTPLKLGRWWSQLQVAFSKFTGRVARNQLGYRAVGCENIAANLQFSERIVSSSGAVSASLNAPKIVGISDASAIGITVAAIPNVNNQVPILVVDNISDGAQADPQMCGYSGGIFDNIRLQSGTTAQSGRFAVGDRIYLTNDWKFSKTPTNIIVGKILKLGTAIGRYTAVLDFWNFELQQNVQQFNINNLTLVAPQRNDYVGLGDSSDGGANKRGLLSSILGLTVASDIKSGTFAAARIPGLAASKVTSGVFAVARIPGLSATKIISGRFHRDRMPSGVRVVYTGTGDDPPAGWVNGDIYFKREA